MDKEKELLKKIDHDIRYIPASHFKPRSVLTAHQWEIDRQLRLHLKSDWFLFVCAGLSAFFDPELYFGVADDEAEVILKSSTLFSIGSPPPHCELRLVVIEPANVLLERFLAKHGVQRLQYSELISADEFAREVDKVLAQTPIKEHIQRQPINYPEFRVRRALMDDARYERENSKTLEYFLQHGHHHDDAHEHLAKTSYRLLHEVALCRLEPTFPFHLSEQAKWIMETSSVDVLLHSRDESSRPLVAVEVDGPHHRELKQIAKDLAKDEVMKAFGIPLFRITPEDAAYWTYHDQLTTIQKERLQNYSKLICHVVSRMATEMNIFGRLQDEVDAREAVCLVEEDALARTVFDRNYLDLTKGETASIDERLMWSPADNDRYTAVQLYNYELEKAIESAKEESSWPDDVAPYLSTATIKGDLEYGLSASTILNFPGYGANELVSPSIRGSVENLEPELIIASLDACLIYFLTEEARRQIRMRTPAKRSGPHD